MEKIKKIKNIIVENKDSAFVESIVIYLVSVLQFIMIDLTSFVTFEITKISYILLLSTILAIKNIIWIKIVHNIKKGLIISSIFTLIACCLLHLVFVYHGTPFLFSDFKNFTTAFNVVRHSNPFLFIAQPRLLLFVLFFLVILKICWFYTGDYLFRKKRARFLFVICALAFIACVFFIEQDPIFFNFEYGIKRYTYIGCITKQALLDFDPYKKPDNYNEESLKEYMKNYVVKDDDGTNQKYPDIILILNEAWFDLSQISDISVEKNPTANFYNINNTIFQYCIVPDECGGTNRTEYELLTSNSLSMASSITPFNSIDFRDANSCVSYLKSLGYYTHANHVMTGDNYNRRLVYNQLGFDEFFFKDDFINLEYWANRKEDANDSSVFKNMEQWYEKMPDNPRFLFCVTMQNHAYYRDNDEKDYILTFLKEDGSADRDWSEYISSLTLTVSAFNELIDYYSKVDRDVIIIMVGDHSPYMANNIYETKDEEEKIHMRSTPLIIWSNNQKYLDNYSNNFTLFNNNRISAYNIFPSIIEMASLPRSGFYDCLIELKKRIPIITSYGSIYDSLSNNYSVDNVPEQYKDIISNMQNIWYGNITSPNLLKTFFMSSK